MLYLQRTIVWGGLLMSTKNERKDEAKLSQGRVEGYSSAETPSIWYS